MYSRITYPFRCPEIPKFSHYDTLGLSYTPVKASQHIPQISCQNPYVVQYILDESTTRSENKTLTSSSPSSSSSSSSHKVWAMQILHCAHVNNQFMTRFTCSPQPCTFSAQVLPLHPCPPLPCLYVRPLPSIVPSFLHLKLERVQLAEL